MNKLVRFTKFWKREKMLCQDLYGFALLAFIYKFLLRFVLILNVVAH